MKKKRFSVEQIVAVLKEAEIGTPVADLIRKVGVSEQTFYRWTKVYGGFEPGQARKLKQLEEQNAKLKRLVADLSLDKIMRQDVLKKKVVRPSRRRDMIRYWETHYEVSERRACAVAMCSRSNYRYRSCRDPRTELRARIREIAHARVRYGYRRVHIVLEREGWSANHKLVYRLYREEGLALRRKRPKRHVSAVHREARIRSSRPNECWSMDFVADQLVSGTRFRALTVLDVFTKECLAIEAGQSLKGEHVVAVLKRIGAQRGMPKSIFCDNGSEFVGRSLDLWAYVNRVRIDFSRPGKPTDNADVESFNGRFRDEGLNSHWFVSMHDATREIEAWRRDYNESRAQEALGKRTPKEFAAAAGTCAGRSSEGMPEARNQSGTNLG